MREYIGYPEEILVTEAWGPRQSIALQCNTNFKNIFSFSPFELLFKFFLVPSIDKLEFDQQLKVVLVINKPYQSAMPQKQCSKERKGLFGTNTTFLFFSLTLYSHKPVSTDFLSQVWERTFVWVDWKTPSQSSFWLLGTEILEERFDNFSHCQAAKTNSHRRRIKNEEKAKVVAVAWGT